MLQSILDSLQPGRLRRAIAGRRWTAVEAEVDGELRCGLAATWDAPPEAERAPVAFESGASALDLARSLPQAEGLPASLAAAALNALLPRQPELWVDARVEDVLRARGRGRSVVMVGHFPFADALRTQVGRLTVLERRPRPGDLPEAAAGDILPSAEVVVITGLAFVNRSLPGLLAQCSPQAHVILAGASVPLSPVFFSHGVHQLCGSVVEDIDPVMQAVAEGLGFRRIHPAGIRRVTLSADGLDH